MTGVFAPHHGTRFDDAQGNQYESLLCTGRNDDLLRFAADASVITYVDGDGPFQLGQATRRTITEQVIIELAHDARMRRCPGASWKSVQGRNARAEGTHAAQPG